MGKVGIEGRCDAPNQEGRAVADGKPVVDHRHGAVGDQALDPRPVDDRRPVVAAMELRYPEKIDGKITHDPFDDIGAEAIFRREPVSLDGGELALGDAREIVPRWNDILNEALRHAPDGAGAETDQWPIAGALALMKVITTYPLQRYDILAFGLRTPPCASEHRHSYYDGW